MAAYRVQPREDVEIIVAVGGEEDDALPPGDLEVGVVQSVTESTATLGRQSHSHPGDPDSLTPFRPYLAHSCPVFSRFLRVSTAWPRRFQRAPSRSPGPRNGGKGTKSGELRPSFDAPDANQRINWEGQKPAGKQAKKKPKKGKPPPEVIAFLRGKRERVRALKAAHATQLGEAVAALSELELDAIEEMGLPTS